MSTEITLPRQDLEEIRTYLREYHTATMNNMDKCDISLRQDYRDEAIRVGNMLAKLLHILGE